MIFRIEELLPVEAWLVDSRFNGKSLSKQFRMVYTMWKRVLMFRFRVELARSNSCAKKMDVLFFKSIKRRDYEQLFQNVVRRFSANQREVFKISVDELRYTEDAYYEKYSIFSFLVNLALIAKIGFSLIFAGAIILLTQGIFKGLWLIGMSIQYTLIIDHLIMLEPKSVVVFAEMQDLDRILSWRCLQKGIPCATMQHGLYVEYLYEDTINKVNYNPRYVSHFLAWGEVTRRLIRKYNPDIKISICGKPLDFCKGHKIIAHYDVVLIMDQNLFVNENRIILDMLVPILKSNHLKAGVLFHPQNNPADYTLGGVNVIENVENVESTSYICHTTSYIVDLVHRGCRVFRYASGKESLPFPPQHEFINRSQLNKFLDTADSDIYSIDTKFYISTWGEESQNSHAAAISAMID